jgi:predicted enzyme related to lactoylglutathione lyase
MAIELKGTLTLAFQVKDRKRSTAWYEKVLGFSLLYDVAEIGWCELDAKIDGGTVSVGFSEVESPKVGRGPVPTFGVVDIDAARAEMEAADVRFDGPTIEIPDMVKLATFYDPDGNALMLSQSLMDGA